MTWIKAGNLCMKLLTPHWPVTLAHVTLRTTSHTRLKARDHCILVSLIGRKDQDLPSPLHTRRWRPKGPRKPSWMKSLDKFLHNKLRRMVHDLLEHLQEIGLTHTPAHQCQLNIWYCLWMRVKVPHNYLVTALGMHVKGPYLKIPWTPRSSPTCHSRTCDTEGHFTHEAGGSWPLHSSVSHWSKRPPRPSKSTSH